MKHKIAASVFLALSALIVPALASPNEVASVIHAGQPYGKGSYGVLVLTAYDAELWTDATQWSMAQPFALTLHYHMGFSTDDFVSRGIKEMKHVDPSLDDTTLKRFGEAMTKVFPPVKAGDTVTALYQPGMPVRIFHNGAATGEIADKDFANPFFGIWLSPNTSAPSLRDQLLHLK
jgi:hypothetical protein